MNVASDRAATRAEILRRAAEALCHNPGLGMSKLTKVIGVSRATLYRYFASREALIHELAVEAIRATDEAAEGIFVGAATYAEAFRRLLGAMIPLGATYHFLSREMGLYDDETVMAEARRQEQQMADLIDAAKAVGEITSALPTRWVAKQFDLVVWLAWSEAGETDQDPAELTEIAFHSFWSGVAP